MEDSNIEWTDHTFNPWIGCAKISAGCTNCYACTLMATRYGRVEWGCHGTRLRTSAEYWKQPERWNRKAEKLGIRYRVFCASLADVFEEYHGNGTAPDCPATLDNWRWDLFELIGRTPHLDWLILTKRPTYAAKYLPTIMDGVQGNEMPWPNIWLGTSVENQAAAEERIPILLSIPARVRFLSCEPLLGPLDLRDGLGLMGCPGDVDWVICGGESGQGARPMHPEWTRRLRDQCETANVPFLFKQWGVWVPGEEHYQGPEWMFQNETLMDSHWFPDFNENPAGWETDYHSVPGSVVVWRNVGKKYAGRLLDGVPHDAIPRLSNI